MAAGVVVSRENVCLVKIFQPGKDELQDRTDTARHVLVDRVRGGYNDNACDHESHEHGKVVPSRSHGSDSSLFDRESTSCRLRLKSPSSRLLEEGSSDCEDAL